MICFAAGSIFMANAQMAQKSPEQRAHHMTKKLAKVLNLSADQSQQVNAILVTQTTRMDSLKANPAPDKKGNRLAARSIMLSSEKNITAILNDTQKQQFMDWLKAKKEKQKEKKEDSLGSK